MRFRCTCPSSRDPFDPYYQCDACEREREEIDLGETEEDLQALADNGGVFPIELSPDEAYDPA